MYKKIATTANFSFLPALAQLVTTEVQSAYIAAIHTTHSKYKSSSDHETLSPKCNLLLLERMNPT